MMNKMKKEDKYYLEYRPINRQTIRFIIWWDEAETLMEMEDIRFTQPLEISLTIKEWTKKVEELNKQERIVPINCDHQCTSGCQKDFDCPCQSEHFCKNS